MHHAMGSLDTIEQKVRRSNGERRPRTSKLLSQIHTLYISTTTITNMGKGNIFMHTIFSHNAASLLQSLTEYRKEHQRRQDRREFDLYDPDSKKKDTPARVSDEDPRSGCSIQWIPLCQMAGHIEYCIAFKTISLLTNQDTSPTRTFLQW